MRHLSTTITFLLSLLITSTHANTEKVIFLAPTSFHLGSIVSSLDTLTPSAPKLRKSLPVAFPTSEQSHGNESWYLLRNLTPGQRHEVRVCWAAVQPTKFDLDVFDLSELYTDPNLLAASSEIQFGDLIHDNSKESALLLRIQATADFFTTNKTRMRAPPPVDVDIILDPFIGNIFPRSLLPTAAYIICLAVASWFISGTIWTRFRTIAGETTKVHEE